MSVQKVSCCTQSSLLTLDDGPKTGCSFQFFGQIHRSDIPQALLQQVEDEIDEPTGVSMIHAPDMKLQGVLVSKNCAMVYELPDISGMKSVLLQHQRAYSNHLFA